MPSGSEAQFLSAVPCAAVKRCVVIGSAASPTGDPLQLVWTWNGKSWTRKAVKLPGTSDEQLTAAHCFSLTSCVMAGITAPATGNTESLLFASWNGKVTAPLTANGKPLAGYWNGKAWKLKAA
ncbi:hypothetical protein EAS64_20990 [Trebonia kvetii]|uniref:Uncharacterized protein n=1 Tax=Trebonia kvetii TaxID=2480626 RepID=A0A6P2BVK0_9ACTN|nr:hypothetical protein [Trebonia kvetii]TVZ02948.1 hypothetical protein EAS64_20990 [Trebonia kvetii]